MKPVKNKESLLLLICLGFSAYFAHVWVDAERGLQPPVVPGIAWQQSPPTVLVRFNGTSGCSCGGKLVESYRICRESGVRFLVASDDHTLAQYDVDKSALSEAVFLEGAQVRYAQPVTSASEVLYIVGGKIKKRWSGITVVKGMIKS